MAEETRKRPVETEAAEVLTSDPPPSPSLRPAVSSTAIIDTNVVSATTGGIPDDNDTTRTQSLLPSPTLGTPSGVAVDAAAPATGTTNASGSSSASRPTKVPRAEKAYKGLRHFSMMVCKKVEEKGTTSYNEVADELVAAVIEERKKEDPGGKFDEKNIRRRVYDALNVLMAMDIIAKDKKEITWKGLPTSATQDLEMLERELSYRRQEVERKREALRELLVQQVCFRNLVDHNQRREAEQQAAGNVESKDGLPPANNKIPLPFIVVNTHSSAVIQCNMSKDKTDVRFDFSMPFEINDDNTILKRLGMNQISRNELRKMLSADLLHYCESNNLLDSILGDTNNPPDQQPPVASSDYEPPYNSTGNTQRS